MMGPFLNSVAVLLLSPLLFALFSEGLYFFSSVTSWGAFSWLGLGMLLYVPVYLVLPRGTTRLLGTLEHELCHAVAIYASFGWVGVIFARDDGNGGTAGSRSYFLVSLAPYFLPLFTLPLLPIRPLVGANGLPIIDLLIGFTLAFHMVEVATTIWANWQSDFTKAGPVALVIVPPALTMLFMVLIAAGVLSDYRLMLDYLRNIVAVTPDYYRAAFAWVSQLAGHGLALAG